MPNIEDTEYQDEEQQELDEDGLAIGLSVLLVIAARLRQISKSTTYAKAREWMAKDMPIIDRYLEQGGDMLAKAADGIIDRMADANDEWAAKFYERAGVEQRKYKDSPRMTEIVDAEKARNDKTAKSLCNTSVVGLVDSDGNFAPIREAYIKTIEKAITAMQTSEQAYTQAIGEAVDTLSKSGLRVRYASGRTMELYGAVRMNVMDGYRATMQELRTAQGDEYGADGVEVSAHSNCAKDHQGIQGRQFTKEAFERENRKLKREIGTKNCRHTVYPVLLGVSTKKYTSKELDELKKRSNRKVTVTGLDGKERTITSYDATQYQRLIERSVRKQRVAQRIAKAAGDKVSEKAYRKEASRLMREYERISKEAGLGTQPERTRVFTLK